MYTNGTGLSTIINNSEGVKGESPR